jgi:hypothetical protein
MVEKVLSSVQRNEEYEYRYMTFAMKFEKIKKSTKEI